MTTPPLGPNDWEGLRSDLHRLLDRCVDQMRDAKDHPWQAPPADLADRYAIGTGGDVVGRVMDQVLPYHGGNTHPKFWGWVQGSGLASDFVAGIAAAAMNTNGGGRNHGINEVERAVIDWTRRKMGFGTGASGVLVAGTSQATVIALQAARVRACPDVRAAGGDAKLTVYAAEGVHNATRKAVELLGLGHDQLRLVQTKDGAMDLETLQQAIDMDRAHGRTPLTIVGTSGSVDLGGYDDLHALSDLANREGIWLHVDGAFGAWTRLADAPWRGLTDGIDRADSIALDFHKWMYVGYDCGLALIADEAAHRAAFAARPAYLKGAAEGLAGGDPWFCDYGIDLSRGNRALKVWCALEMFGEEAFAAAITRNCAQASFMADQVQTHGMTLAAPVVSNICVFTAAPELPADQQSALNAKIATHLQLKNATVFSTTDVNGITCLRAAITNHRTRNHHIAEAIADVAKTAQLLKGSVG
ncbi:pyridoxal-dependent decarboxylase [Aliiroseovarius sp. PrR006]|uniref:pyridoxal phosphate-dependent decarboxylase family protein n=1 Tax=Aliiroseovarius sp. PrR006 TaxID=2706883 RepID=UPI0013D362CE|nr:pyridoxal-dependent decarboxylase [Aliiroseovarius sp. PrR006]NDW53999.1 amino acid decarboxylase [Aliiroseovarius sp. PrR006]